MKGEKFKIISLFSYFPFLLTYTFCWGVIAQEMINLNTITWEELIRLPGIGAQKAEAILEYRQKKGGFRHSDELKQFLSEQAIKDLTKFARIYAVPENVWEQQFTKDLSQLYPERMTVRFFPIKGESVYIRLPDGGNILIDTGEKESAGNLVRLLKQEIIGQDLTFQAAIRLGWQPRIDWLILTNITPSRIGGLEEVLKKFRVDQIITGIDLPRLQLEGDALTRTLATLLLSQRNWYLLASQKLDLRQTISKVKLIALAPRKLLSPVKYNPSLALKVTYLNFSILLPSDIDQETQIWLLGNSPQPLKSTILYEGENLQPDFRKKVSPEVSFQPGEELTIITDGQLIYIPK